MAGFMDGHLPCKKHGIQKESDKMSRSMGICMRKWKKVCGKDCGKA